MGASDPGGGEFCLGSGWDMNPKALWQVTRSRAIGRVLCVPEDETQGFGVVVWKGWRGVSWILEQGTLGGTECRGVIRFLFVCFLCVGRDLCGRDGIKTGQYFNRFWLEGLRSKLGGCEL